MEDAEDQAASAVMEDDEGPLPQNTDRELSSPDVLRAKAAEAQKARVGMAETMAEATEALEAVQRSMNSSLVDDETANEAEAEIEDEVGEELVDTVPENTIDEDPVDTGLQSGEVVEQDETDADAEGIGKQVSGAEDTVEENVASGEHQGEAADGGEDGTVTEDMVEENVAPSGNQVEAVERGEGEAQEPLVDDGGNKLSSEQAQVRWAFVGGFVGNTQEVHENVASGGKQVEEADVGANGKGTEDMVEENVASSGNQGEAADGFADGTVTEDMVEENVAPSGNQAEEVERGEGEAQEPLVDDGGNKLSSEQAQVRWAFVGGFVGSTQEVHENVASSGKQDEETDGVVNKTQKSVVDAQDRGMFDEKQLQSSEKEDIACEWSQTSAGSPKQQSEPTESGPFDIEGYARRAMIFLQAGKMPEAIRDLEECTRLNPDDSGMFVRLVNLCIGNQDHVKALSVVRQGLTRHPDNAELKSLLDKCTLNIHRKADDSSIERHASDHGTTAKHSSHGPTQLGSREWEVQRDYRWMRSTVSGRWYTPLTSSMSAIEARQRKIREKCVEQTRRKQQGYVEQRQAMLRARDEKARVKHKEAKKRQITKQLDIILECVNIIDKEKLITFGNQSAVPAAKNRRSPAPAQERFTNIEDVVGEIHNFLEREYPMSDHRMKALQEQDRNYAHKIQTQVVENAINHVVQLSKQSVNPRKWLPSRTGSRSMSGLSSSSGGSPVSPFSPSTDLRKTQSVSSPMESRLPSILSAISASQEKSADICSRAPIRAKNEWPVGRKGPLAVFNPDQLVEDRVPASTTLPEGEAYSRPVSRASSSASGFVRDLSGAQAASGSTSPALGPMAPSSSDRSKLFAIVSSATGKQPPSYTKLPVKTWSSSLAFACGLQSRGGFL